jgi:hypothetical protein
MPTSSTSTLSLAGRLRDLGDDELVALLTLREVRDARIRDFFDLADALLDAASIEGAVSTLDRMTLAAIGAVGELGAALGATSATVAARIFELDADAASVESNLTLAYRLALVDRDGETWLPYAPVTDLLAGWASQGLPTLDELVSVAPPTTLAPVSSSDHRFTDHTAGERAFGATNAIAALVTELQREPARELARGGIALPESKRLAAAMSVELDKIPALIEIAERAGLAASDEGFLLPTEAAGDWLLRSNGERWARLAGAWFARLPDDIRKLLASRTGAEWGEQLVDYVRWLYPAGGEWMRDRTLVYSRDAELLGITANQAPSTAGSELIGSGEAAAARIMTAAFPPEIEKVYLQHDLTIVAAGPLAPALDARLRSMAAVESRALATTYRVSEATINRALTTGETSASILAFLGSISLSGIPQPLEYLVVGAAARFGSLRVGRIADETASDGQPGSRSYVTAEDSSLLSAILVDHGLTALGLTRVGPYRAVSRFDFDVVFWSLSEARYPVAAENESGRIIVLDRRRIARSAPHDPTSAAQSIVSKLRLGGQSTATENSQAWLERQLDTAIKGKLALTVTVAMPDGSSVDLQLEPASLAGGRLRARDRRSDLERTLPLSSITAVSPLEQYDATEK